MFSCLALLPCKFCVNPFFSIVVIVSSAVTKRMKTKKFSESCYFTLLFTDCLYWLSSYHMSEYFLRNVAMCLQKPFKFLLLS